MDTTENLADMLTKGLTAEVRDKLEACLMKTATLLAEESAI